VLPFCATDMARRVSKQLENGEPHPVPNSRAKSMSLVRQLRMNPTTRRTRCPTS
jgi:hypothetical protein